MIRLTSYLNLCACITVFKFLFLNSYVSTDFDVHRNWMAITYNVKMRDWYHEATSEWTLDYPPLFAIVEFLLALIASMFDIQDALILTKHAIRSQSIITYQKVTVIATDLVYYYAIYRLCQAIESQLESRKCEKDSTKSTQSISNLGCQNLREALYCPKPASSVALLLLLQPILFLIDHIHFQYNGLLSGILLLSIYHVIECNYVRASFWFAILLNMKHIYLYCAPSVGMYLLTSYCLAKPSDGRNRIISSSYRIFKLGLTVVLVTLVVFSPFLDLEALGQILSRLFPFKRGLTHAYWAPNIWTLYNVADKGLTILLKPPPKAEFNLDTITPQKRHFSTGGLVQEYDHQYLPSISPLTTFALVGIFTLPLVVKFMLNIGKSSSDFFLKGLTLASFTSFMFGWHVHEKAILLVMLPLIPASFIDKNIYNLLIRMTLVSTYSILPLLFKPAEYPIKICLLIAYYQLTKSMKPGAEKQGSKSLDGRAMWALRKLYELFDIFLLWALFITEVYITLLHGRLDGLHVTWGPLMRLNQLEFLPLLTTSFISALGVTFSYLELYYHFLVTTPACEVDGCP